MYGEVASSTSLLGRSISPILRAWDVPGLRRTEVEISTVAAAAEKSCALLVHGVAPHITRLLCDLHDTLEAGENFKDNIFQYSMEKLPITPRGLKEGKRRQTPGKEWE